MTKTANSLHKIEIFNLAGEKKYSLESRKIKEKKYVLASLSYENKVLDSLIIKDIMFEFGEFDNTEFNNIHMNFTDLVGVWVTDAVFSKCILTDVMIYDCTMYGDVFNSCTFNNVIFRGVSLGGSIFDKCTFNNCKFTSDNIKHFTDLSDTQFLNCSLKSTVFNDIDINKNTILPI